MTLTADVVLVTETSVQLAEPLTEFTV